MISLSLNPYHFFVSPVHSLTKFGEKTKTKKKTKCERERSIPFFSFFHFFLFSFPISIYLFHKKVKWKDQSIWEPVVRFQSSSFNCFLFFVQVNCHVASLLPGLHRAFSGWKSWNQRRHQSTGNPEGTHRWGQGDVLFSGKDSYSDFLTYFWTSGISRQVPKVLIKDSCVLLSNGQREVMSNWCMFLLLNIF